MDKINFYWNGFEPVLRVLIVGTLAYFAIVLLIRISGKRTLAKMNAFDFIITVTIGSAFGRILTAKSVSISEAITAFFILVFLQFIFSWVESRFPFFRRIITSQPIMLYYNGGFIDKNLRKERLNKDDILASIRKKGFGSLKEVEVVIMETDGTLSVIGKFDNKNDITFSNLLDNKN